MQQAITVPPARAGLGHAPGGTAAGTRKSLANGAPPSRTSGLAVLAGEAGTGKSTTLAASATLRERRLPVIGTSWTNQVVQNLKQDGFRDATTVAAEDHLDRGSSRWDRRTVLIVDEAACCRRSTWPR